MFKINTFGTKFIGFVFLKSDLNLVLKVVKFPCRIPM